ncbi:MAG TPA: DUF6370 family protein [Gemmataceae bacterium]|nr:DUF6370 family protein [Gemmataceae bacterium]
MRTALSMLLGVAIVFALTLSVRAEEKKEVTVTGTITCAKCDLKVADKCATVIKGKAKGSDKEETYYFDEKGNKDNHKAICQAAKAGKVTGTVSEKDGKKVITVSKVEFDK